MTSDWSNECVERALFITLNPSVSYTIQCNVFEEGRVTRCIDESLEWANGKANIAARVFQRLGGSALTLFPGDSYLGKRIEELLLSDGILVTRVPISHGTRRTFVIRNTYHSPPVEREYLEPGPKLSREVLQLIVARACEATRPGMPVAIAGSLPRGCPKEFYHELISCIKANCPSSVVVLDTSGDALKCSMGAPFDFIKVNNREFSELENISETLPEKELCDSIKRVADRTDASIIVTRGEKPVIACLRGGPMLRAEIPKFSVLNTIGAGDSFTAGLIKSLRWSTDDGIAYAIACAGATLGTIVPGEIERETCNELMKRVVISKA